MADMIPVQEDNDEQRFYVLRALGRTARTLPEIGLAKALDVDVERMQLIPNHDLRRRLECQHRRRTAGYMSILPEDPF